MLANIIKVNERMVAALPKGSMIVFLAALLLMASPFFPVPEGMGEKGWSAFFLLTLTIALWGTKWVPAPIVSMVVVALSALLGILTFEEAAVELGNETIWLIIAMLMMGTVLEKFQLDKRVAYHMLLWANGKVKWTLFNLFATGFILTFFIPNAVGRLTVLLPIAQGIIAAMGQQGGKNLSKSMILCITFVPYVATIATMTGASGSIYAVGLFQSMLGYSWSYLHWVIVMVPMTVVILLLLWGLLLWLYPANVTEVASSRDYVQEEVRKLGPSKQEVKLICLYLLLILLWATKEIHGLSIALCAILVLISLFLPGIRLAEWKPMMKGMDWGIPFLFVAGFTLANTLEKGGFVQWVLTLGTQYLSPLSSVTLALAMLGVFVVIRLVFTNYTAMAATLMPVALTFAMGTSFNPMWLGMLCLVACSIGFLLPIQSIGNMMTFSMGYYTNRELFISGGLLTILVLVVTVLAAFFYWPMVGLPIW